KPDTGIISRRSSALLSLANRLPFEAPVTMILRPEGNDGVSRARRNGIPGTPGIRNAGTRVSVPEGGGCYPEGLVADDYRNDRDPHKRPNKEFGNRLRGRRLPETLLLIPPCPKSRCWHPPTKAGVPPIWIGHRPSR